MAIPASGSVSLSTIQSEWGGSNPISMNEYYSGSLATNSTSSSVSPTVGTLTHSVYTPGGKGYAAYTTYYRASGFRSTSITFSTILSGTTLGSNSATWTTTSGIDQVGNAGQIPSSGAIQMNHFRGTNGSATSSNLLSYGFQVYQSSGNPSGPWSTTLTLWISGHYGTNGTTGNNWSNVPFRWIDSPAKGGVAATRWYGSDSHSSNGNNTGKGSCIHDTFPTIGACTRYIYNTNISASISMSGTWTLTVQR